MLYPLKQCQDMFIESKTAVAVSMNMPDTGMQQQ